MNYQILELLQRVTITNEILHLDSSTGETDYINKTSGIVSTTPTYTTIDIKEELQKVILERNTQHFAKATNKPWIISLLNKINSETNYNLEKDVNETPIALLLNSTKESMTLLGLLE